jgi:hypothetical protein
MPHEIIWEPKGVYKRFSGHVSAAEFLNSQEEVLADPRIDSARYVINDFLGVTSYVATKDDAEYSAAYNRGANFSNPRLRVACITTSPGIRVLVAAAALVSTLKLKAFSSQEEARRWADEQR